MIDVKNLKVGDTFYSVKETNNAFHRKKIVKVIDGVEWFKYSEPLRSYEIVTYTVKGILRKELEGEWPESELYALDTEYSVSSGRSDYEFYSTDLEYESFREYFFAIEEAEAYKTHLEELAKEMDRT